MASKQIKLNAFSEKSIKDAIKSLTDYKKEFVAKCNEFTKRLADEGISCANMVMTGAVGDALPLTFEYLIGADGSVIGMRGSGGDGEDGKINSIVIWEFGAGVTYNHSITSQNPLASTFESVTHISTDIGSYGQHQGLVGYWLTPSKKYSEGSQAMMPMYKASIEMISKIDLIANEVFNG